MRRCQESLLLAGDLGATKTTLAVYEITDWPGPSLYQRTFPNAEYTDFDHLLGEFLEAGQSLPAHLCLGVAGPVLANAVRMTNLNWTIDASSLCDHFGFSQVKLINDLVATAAGIPYLEPQDLHVLNPGTPVGEGVIAVLAPGSGLGEAFLIPHQGRYLPYPSEGGHVSFAPRNKEQRDLLTFMSAQQTHVSVEQVCSGLAIPHLLTFEATRHPIPDWLYKELQQATDHTPVIVQAALSARGGKRPCPIAVHTLELFLDILADEAANLALKTLAVGGVFLGGGLAPRLMPIIDPQRFMTLFARGTYREMLSHIPVRIVVNPQTALLGAAAYGIDALVSGHP
jgi:glucokinase